MVYEQIDFAGQVYDKQEIEKISLLHNMTPKQWVPGYMPTKADVEETIARILNTPPEDFLLAVARDVKGEIQGFIWADRKKETANRAMILSLYVEPTHRKQGLAMALKALLEDWCRASGINKIETTVHYTNSKMIRLNEKLGYKAGMVTMEKTI